MSDPLRLVALLSGTGSNLKILLQAQREKKLSLDFLRVISNKAAAGGLDHAQEAGVDTSVINNASSGAEGEDAAIEALLRELNPDLVLLTGYMRILGASPVNAFRGKMINQHPSLLPRYKGLHTYRQVLEAGDAEHGASIHFVTPELDDGPVVAQVRVPVLSGDTEASLAARLQPREHALLLALMVLFADRRITMQDNLACLDGAPMTAPLQLGSDNSLV